MKNTFTIMKSMMLIMATVSTLSLAAPMHMIEVIELQKGKKLSDVTQYLQKVTPIIEQYGATNEQVYLVQQMGDETQVQRVALVWEIENMENLPKVFQDAAYNKHVPLRDSILKVGERVQFLGHKVE